MLSLRIRNLRSLTDTGLTELKPLTLLVGQNSSGKSTFLRSLPLLRQSVEIDTAGPILWFGRLVDFGSFNEAAKNGADPREIKLDFKLKIDPAERIRMYHFSTRFRPIDLEFSIAIVGDSDITTSKSFTAEFCGHKVGMVFGEKGDIERFTVNDRDILDIDSDMLYLQRTGILPDIYWYRRSDTSRQRLQGFDTSLKVVQQQVNLLNPYFHGRTGTSARSNAVQKLCIGESEDMLSSLKTETYRSNHFRERISTLKITDDRFLKLRDLAVANFVPLLLKMANTILNRCFQGVSYTAPLRADTERYYRTQGLAIEELDPRGTNLAMFLGQDSNELNNFSDWTDLHLGFVVNVRKEGGHSSLHLRETATHSEFNLADLGFGFSQLLPVVLHLWKATTNKVQATQRLNRNRLTEPEIPIIAIEQPELHLHPGLQAKVADLLIALVSEARKSGETIALIIETHSEAIINRIGSRIAEMKNNEPLENLAFDPNDFQVLIFDKNQAGSTTVTTATYNGDGYLENWPYGFFEPDI